MKSFLRASDLRQALCFLRLKLDGLFQIISCDANGCFPGDFIWEWRVDFLVPDQCDDLLMRVSRYSLNRIIDVSCLRDGEKPVFDGFFAKRVFGDDEYVNAIASEIRNFQLVWLVDHLEFGELGKFSDYLSGIRDGIDLAKSVTGMGASALRIITSHAACCSSLYESLMCYIESRIHAKNAPAPVSIFSEMRRFSSAWPASWSREIAVSSIMKDAYGQMRGIINLDTGIEDEAILAMTSIAARSTDRRNLPFEFLRLSYPEIPSRENIEDDIRTILSCYNMIDHPALWAVARKKGKKYGVICALCRIPRFPDDSGSYGVPRTGITIDKDYGRGRISRQCFWPGAREMALARICEKYGYSQDSLSFDKTGRQIGPVFPGPMSERRE